MKCCSMKPICTNLMSISFLNDLFEVWIKMYDKLAKNAVQAKSRL